MSVYYNVSAGFHTRALDYSLDQFTEMVWVFPFVGSIGTRVMTYRNDGIGDTQWINLGLDSSERLFIENQSAGDSGSTIVPTDQWSHFTIVKNGDDYFGYLNGSLEASFSDSSSVAGINITAIGSIPPLGGLGVDGLFAAVKRWEAVLTETEIRLEMTQISPLRHANLHAFYPLLSTENPNEDDTRDYSKNNRTLTGNGIILTDVGPPIPWRRYKKHTYSTTAGTVLAGRPATSSMRGLPLPCWV